jgi:hypothetical protein
MMLSIFGFSKAMFFLVLIVILIIRHNLLLKNTMNNITESNRHISGNLVWLNMIPIFNIFWIIIFNSALNKSIEAEIQHKQINFRFLGITGILFPFVIYGTLLSYIVLEISGITNSSESISELTLITVIFSAMAIFWGWLYYIAEIASFNKMNTESEETNYRKIAVYIIVIVSVLLTLVLSYNYWNNYTIQQDYERSQN